MALLDTSSLIYYKKLKLDQKVKRLKSALLADALALVPLVGAHLSWRVAIQDYRFKFTPIFRKGLAQLLEHHPKIFSAAIFNLNVCKNLNGQVRLGKFEQVEIEVETSKITRYLRASHFKNNPDTPTVIVFGGNNATDGDMSLYADPYTEMGYNVLTFTIGGYPGSRLVAIAQGKQINHQLIASEKTLYQDIEAVKLYLQEQGVTKVAYHGLSLGGSQAFQAAVGQTNATKLETLFVVADQTFTSVSKVSGNAVSNTVKLPQFLGKGFGDAVFPAGRLVELPGNLWTVTDNVNNLAKAKLMKEQNIPLYCVASQCDFLMGKGRKSREGGYEDNFAHDLFKARYSADEDTQDKFYTLNGDHGSNVFCNRKFIACMKNLLKSNLSRSKINS